MGWPFAASKSDTTTRRILKDGFTIVELLIVIVVIGILAAITMVAFQNIDKRAAAAATLSSHQQFVKKIEAFRVETGGYPTSVTDCPNPAATSICLPSKDGQAITYYAFSEGPNSRVGSYTQNAASTAYELEIRDAKGFHYGSNAELTGSNEFLQYTDMAPIINKYGLRPYKISFDIKSANTSSRNTMQVYLQNGSGARHSFTTNVPVTTSFERRTVTVTPTMWDSSLTHSMLAFFGTYSTGNRPTVRNVEIVAG